MPLKHSFRQDVTKLYSGYFIKVYYSTECHIMNNHLQKSDEVANVCIFQCKYKTHLKSIALFNEAEATLASFNFKNDSSGKFSSLY